MALHRTTYNRRGPPQDELRLISLQLGIPHDAVPMVFPHWTAIIVYGCTPIAIVCLLAWALVR